MNKNETLPEASFGVSFFILAAILTFYFNIKMYNYIAEVYYEKHGKIT